VRHAGGGATANFPADALRPVVELLGEVDEPPEQRLPSAASTPATSSAIPTSKPTTPRRFRACTSRSAGESCGGTVFEDRLDDSWKSSASMIAVPMILPIDGELDPVRGPTWRCQTSGGTGRASRRDRTSAVDPAVSRAPASARRTRASAVATSRSGQALELTSRPTATAVSRRSARVPRSTWTPG